MESIPPIELLSLVQDVHVKSREASQNTDLHMHARKALQNIPGELLNDTSKLTEIDKRIKKKIPKRWKK